MDDGHNSFPNDPLVLKMLMLELLARSIKSRKVGSGAHNTAEGERNARMTQFWADVARFMREHEKAVVPNLEFGLMVCLDGKAKFGWFNVTEGRPATPEELKAFEKHRMGL